MDELIDRSRGTRRIAVLTGAGISTASGIPGHRGPEGVRTRTPSAVNAFTLENFMADADVRRGFWRACAGHAAWRAEPDAPHRALAELDGEGVAVRVLTQNVDDLHERAGLAARKVLELPGTRHTTRCARCPARLPAPEVPARVEAGDDDPRCARCGGVLRLDIVLSDRRWTAPSSGPRGTSRRRAVSSWPSAVRCRWSRPRRLNSARR
jgi:NAD-dependent deacetylase